MPRRDVKDFSRDSVETIEVVVVIATLIPRGMNVGIANTCICSEFVSGHAEPGRLLSLVGPWLGTALDSCYLNGYNQTTHIFAAAMLANDYGDDCGFLSS